MTRILILANNDIGLYKFRKELIIELLQHHEVFISLPDGKFVKDLIKLGCTYINTPISRRGTNPITDFKLLQTYNRIIKKTNPDIVLTYTIKPNIYGGLVCRMNKIPYIPNITGLGTAVENKGILQKITILLYKLSMKSAKCIFFQNKDNANFFIKNNIIKGNHKIIPGSGVNLDYYQYLDYPNENQVNFIYISRIMKEKGIEQYLDAATYIKNKYPNTVFHILGFCEESYEEKLKKLEKQGIIKYHGMKNDIRKYLEIIHCTIHPSFYPEGMSNVLLESASSGRPVITTNRTGCKEIVDDNITGYIVEPQDSKDLIEKIESFLNLTFEEKQKMGIAGRNKVEREFNRKIVIDKYKEQINLILEGF